MSHIRMKWLRIQALTKLQTHEGGIMEHPLAKHYLEDVLQDLGKFHMRHEEGAASLVEEALTRGFDKKSTRLDAQLPGGAQGIREAFEA